MSIKNSYERKLNRINNQHSQTVAYDSMTGKIADENTRVEHIEYKTELSDKGQKKLNRLNS